MRKRSRKYRLQTGKPRSRWFLKRAALAVCGVGMWLWISRQETRPRQTPLSPNSNKPAPVFKVPASNTTPARAQPPATAESTPTTTTRSNPPVHVAVQDAPRAPETTLKPAPTASTTFPRPASDIAEAQIALARQGISPGPVDGLIGSQTRSALAAFQLEQGLPQTGELDVFTRELLILQSPPVTNYVVTSNDLERLQPLSATWLGKSQQSALEYETLIELLSETTRAHPNYLRKLNPEFDWAGARPGQSLRVPDTSMPALRSDAAFIRIFLSRRLLQVFDSRSNLLAHFPCSIAQKVEKRPAGELHVTAIAPDPNYTFDPSVFPESAEARTIGHKLILPAGPNNPVGVAWISLHKPGYGIHGTPQPEQVGRTESHGCFRLANWNAKHLVRIVRIGMPVYVEN